MSLFKPCFKKSTDPKTHARRLSLKTFILNTMNEPIHPKKNHCDFFISILTKATTLLQDDTDLTQPSKSLVDDLEAVLIGKNMHYCRRKGTYFAGDIMGSTGFCKTMRDPYNQIQHATAGIVIGYRYGWLGYRFVRFFEQSKADDCLYDATCPLGQTLNDTNFLSLPERTKTAISQDHQR